MSSSTLENKKTDVAKDFYFSYSSLNKLLGNPRLFYKEYILGDKEIKTEKYLLEGSVIHNLLLEPDTFSDKFCVTPSLPSPNSIQIIKQIFQIYEDRLHVTDNPDLFNKIESTPPITKSKLADFEDEILDCLETMGLHQKVGKEKRAFKIIEPKGIDYFEHLKNSKGKIIIDSEILSKCTESVLLIKEDEKIMSLLGQDETEGKAVFNELEIIEEFSTINDGLIVSNAKNLSFKGLKGIVDNVVIDQENKLVTINDFKTTSKSLDEFEKSVEYYNYSLQASIYLILVNTWVSKLLSDSYSDYQIKFNFIVFDKYNYLYAFPVSEETLMRWKSELINSLYMANYCKQTNSYNLPYKYLTGSVSL